MLHAVVEYGGFAQASAALHKSQSTISYAVNKLQDQLGLRVVLLYMVFPDDDNTGPATQALAEIVRKHCCRFEMSSF